MSTILTYSLHTEKSLCFGDEKMSRGSIRTSQGKCDYSAEEAEKLL